MQRTQVKFAGSTSFVGTTKGVKGKTATLGGPKTGSTQIKSTVKIKSITTFGKDPATSNEQQTLELLQRVLEGDYQVFSSNPLMRLLFSLDNAALVSLLPHMNQKIPAKVTKTLNEAQGQAVSAFCTAPTSTGPVIQLVHGPPGTGKTTLIASNVQWLAGPREAIYIVAQSNVAVKNVAEKLESINFLDFRLVVSEDFFLEWYVAVPRGVSSVLASYHDCRHEHLYERIQQRVIRSSQLPEDPRTLSRKLGGARVILCTLSMLANTRLIELGLTSKLLRPTTLIVDEASQIALCDYLPSLNHFHRTIRRICFVGDHKQREFLARLSLS